MSSNQPQTNDFRGWFERYTQGFKEPDGQFLPMVRLKYDHCHRVASDARQLAQSLQWAPEECDIAELLGLFHDIGRFSQFKEYGTFYDRKSINHAERGAEVLKTCPLFSQLPALFQTCLHDGILFHSRRFLPDQFEEKALSFARLIRDADKLDDFFVLNDAIRRNDTAELQDIIWNLSMDAPPSPIVINDLLHQRITSYDQLKSLSDFNLIQLSWIFDINFLPAFQKIAERRIIDRIEEVIQPHPDLPLVFQTVRSFLAEKIAA